MIKDHPSILTPLEEPPGMLGPPPPRRRRFASVVEGAKGEQAMAGQAADGSEAMYSNSSSGGGVIDAAKTVQSMPTTIQDRWGQIPKVAQNALLVAQGGA